MAERALIAKTHEVKRENSASQIRKAEHIPSVGSPVDRVLFLQRTLGNQAVQRLMNSGALQAKLRIGAPGDVYEQEADRVAERVMRMKEPKVSESNVDLNNRQRDTIQRKCQKCTGKPLSQSAKEDEEKELQAKEITDPTPEVEPEMEARINAIRGTGQPLPESVRAFFEPRFGQDFSGVRVHADTKAAEAARGVDARAFTVGRDVVFGEGEYAPKAIMGQRLIAHELTHVIQQNPQHYDVSGLYNLNQSSDLAERKATENQALAIKGEAIEITKQMGTKPVMRQPENKEESPGVLATIGGGLVGEFNEDPTFAMIGVDMGVSLIPILDQASDIRDISAHVYYMTADKQYKNPGRWVGLVFSLIGLFPEIGSAIKSISKFAIKGIHELLSHLEDLFKLLRRVLPDMNDISRFQRYIADNWDNIVKFGKRAWEYTVEKASHWVSLISIYASKWISRLSRSLSEKWRQIKEAWAVIKEIAPKKLDEAFAWVRRKVDNILEQVRERLGGAVESIKEVKASKAEELKAPGVSKTKIETLEEYKARGGKITIVPPQPSPSGQFITPSSKAVGLEAEAIDQGLTVLTGFQAARRLGIGVERHHAFFSYLLRAFKKAGVIKEIPKHKKLVELGPDLHQEMLHQLWDSLKSGLERGEGASNRIANMIKEGKITPKGIANALVAFYNKLLKTAKDKSEQEALEKILEVVRKMRKDIGI